MFLLLLIFALALIINMTGVLNISIKDLSIALFVFSAISALTLTIFFIGQKKEPESQILFTLTSITSKLLLEMVFALFWFIIAKKRGLESFLLFFVLYLALTLFWVSVLLKTLKNKLL